MKSLLWILTLIPAITLAQGQIVLEGVYQGKNIYVQNPYATDGASYCTDSVKVNGIKIEIENANAYEVRLDTLLELKVGDKVKMEIFHKPDCKPKVFADHGSRKSTFEIVTISIDTAKILHWTTVNEVGKLPYVIETFVWNKWIKIGEVDGKAEPGENHYSFHIEVPYSGENKIRVKQADYSGQPRMSKHVSLFLPDQQVEILGNKKRQWEAIHFSKKTMYELYNYKGDIVKRGTGSNIGIKGLHEGDYYLNFDDKMETIVISPH